MRAGLVIYGTLDTASGGYLYDRRLVAHLRAAGDSVEIISLPWSSYGRHLALNRSRSLWQRLRHSHFDVLLQDELNHPSLFALNRRLRGQVSYPLVSIVHHLRSSERHPAWALPLYRRVERSYLRGVDGFICNSHTTLSAVNVLCGCSKPSVVAYPAADHVTQPGMDNETAVTDGPLRLLFVGNVIPRKNLHMLIDALAQLPRDSWRLAITGDAGSDPRYTRRVQDQIGAAGLEERVGWHGRVMDDELGRHFGSSDLLIVPSSYEGFGIVYLEAMAWSLPAIAGEAGAAHEIITHGENGFLVPPDDPAALARTLRPLLADRARLKTMRRAARARYAAAPDWETSMAGAREYLLRISAAPR